MRRTMDLRILLAFLVGLVGVVVFFALAKSRKSRSKPAVVICGPSGSGKTALWAKLAGVPIQATVTSTTPNSTVINSTKYVDCPGLAKLRNLTVSELQSALKVVFMVDAASPKTLSEAAPALYEVLLIAEKRQVPVLIAANKYDLFSTVSVKKVRKALETEINAIRESKQRNLNDASTLEPDEHWLGTDEPFEFEHLETPVEILEGSVKADRIQNWQDFMNN